MTQTNADAADPTSKASKSLTVLPHSGKVEQLRQEAQQEAESKRADSAAPAAQRATPSPPAAGLPQIRTALDPSHAAAHDPNLTPEQRAVEQKVIDALRTIYDPEIPVNIYELGLIYSVKVDTESRVHVRMTLTAPACPVAGTLPGEVETRIEAIPEVKSATVELVWEPQWDRSMMSEAAMLQLGFL
jgi:FeS assembly SUF system protein